MIKFGLSEKTLNIIVQELKQHAEIDKALIFGSRAKNNFKNGSDVDIALFGCAVTTKIAWDISGKLNCVLPIPYFFDIVSYNNIKTNELKDHINRIGVIFYRGNTGGNKK